MTERITTPEALDAPPGPCAVQDRFGPAPAPSNEDREALRDAMLRHWWSTQTGPDADLWESLDAEERENVAENSYVDTFLDALMPLLAARGIEVTP